jgi:metal-dependent hydrolase (beta-lactamase superfamily II)
MTDVTGKVVKIQLTIEYTKADNGFDANSEGAAFHTKEVIIDREYVKNIAAMVLSSEAPELMEDVNVINNVKTDLGEQFTLDENSELGFNGTENTQHTLCIIKTDGTVIAGCSATSHTPYWEIQ